MSSELEARERVAVGSGDITITESGGVEVVNIRLADALRRLIEEDRRGGEAALSRSNVCNNTCPVKVNGNKCPMQGA